MKTGKQDAKDSADAINNAISGFLTPALLAFGFIAVFVGAFIIFNTFSITVAQRVREFAMLRALGAARRQVMTAVVLEALLIGLLASVVGIAGGYLVAAGIGSIFDSAGLGLPEAGAALSANAVIIGLVVGVGTTLVASIAPARRATRIAPVAALREGAELPRGFIARWSPVIALVLTLAGTALIASGFRGGGGTSAKLLAMAAGAVLVFFAVATIARYLVPAIARVLGWPLAHLSRSVGRVARDNSMRNPGRTAVTSSALMVGIAIAVFVAVFAQGLKVGIGDALSQGMRGNVVVQSSASACREGRPALDRGRRGSPSAAAIFTDRMRLGDGSQHGIIGLDPHSFTNMWKIRWIDGSDATVRSLGTTGFIIDQDLARSLHLHVGKPGLDRGPHRPSHDPAPEGHLRRPQLADERLCRVDGGVRPHLDQPRCRSDPREDLTRASAPTPGSTASSTRCRDTRRLRHPDVDAVHRAASRASSTRSST